MIEVLNTQVSFENQKDENINPKGEYKEECLCDSPLCHENVNYMEGYLDGYFSF